MYKMKILLSGGLGFIGTSLIKKLSKQQLIVCSKNNKTKIENFKNVVFEFVNIESDDFLNIVTKHKPDLLIHMAAFTGLKNCENNPHQAFETNVYGTFNVIKACISNKTRLIFLSSREVYGSTSNEINENHPLKPTNVYGITKYLSEKMIVSEHEKSHLNYTILRLANVYGPGGINGVNRIIQSAVINNKILLNGGKQLVNLIYIDDLIDIILKILTNEQSINQIFNVGSLDNISIKEFSEKVSTLCLDYVKIIQNEPLKFENMDFKPNIDKLQNILDFSPKTNLQDGIQKTIKWFEQNLDENKN